MSETQETCGKLSISLRENGAHSFWRGIKSYEQYERTQDMMLLKDAIMQLHHGVELLMKEILAKHSPYLIFEDLGDASKKQKKADEKGIGIFFLERPPRTVSFEESINRVDAFVKPSELDDDLRNQLGRLNRLRNQLEHYAIEADMKQVTQLLAALREPLLDLFEAELDGIKTLQTPNVRRIWDGIQDSAREYVRLEQEVVALVQRFNGQKVPGRLLNVKGELTLPTFTQVLGNYYLPEYLLEIDVLAEGQDVRWAIEVKASLRSPTDVLHGLVHLGMIGEATPWLVVFSQIPLEARQMASQLGVLVSGADEWYRLKELIAPESS